MKEIRTLEDAYQLANELENSEINTIYATLVEDFLEKEDRRRFLKSELDIHFQTIIEFAKIFDKTKRQGCIIK